MNELRPGSFDQFTEIVGLAEAAAEARYRS